MKAQAEIEIPDIVDEEEVKNPETPIENFLSECRKKQTRKGYHWSIMLFLDYIVESTGGKPIVRYAPTISKSGTPRRNIVFDKSPYEKLAVKYLAAKKRNRESDLKNFAIYLSDVKKVSAGTAHLRLMGVRQFLKYHGFIVTDAFKNTLKNALPPAGVTTEFQYINKEKLTRILTHCDARQKAFVLTLASTGLRLSECLNIKLNDMTRPDRTEDKDTPISIRIPAVIKRSKPRTVYLTKECERAVKEWDRVRKWYIEANSIRIKNLPNGGESRRGDIVLEEMLFPWGTPAAEVMWKSLLKKSGLSSKDSHTGREQLNLHRLRNWFSVQVTTGANSQVAEIFLGHRDPQGGAYNGRTGEQLQEEFQKCEPYLTVATADDPATLKKVVQMETELNAMRERSRALEQIVADHMRLIQEQKKQLDQVTA